MAKQAKQLSGNEKQAEAEVKVAAAGPPAGALCLVSNLPAAAEAEVAKARDDAALDQSKPARDAVCGAALIYAAAAETEATTEAAYLAAAGAKWDSGLLLGAAALADKVDAGDSILRARGQFLRDVKAKTLAHKDDKDVVVPATPEGGLSGYITARVIPAIASARPDHAKELETRCEWAKARSWIASEFGPAAAGQTRNFEAIAHYKVLAEVHKARKRAVATDETRDSVKVAITNAQRETAAAFRKALVGAGILDPKASSSSSSSKPNAGKLVSDLTGPELGAIVAGRPAELGHVLSAIEADKDLAEALCAWIAERPAIMGRAAAISEAHSKALAKTGS